MAHTTDENEFGRGIETETVHSMSQAVVDSGPDESTLAGNIGLMAVLTSTLVIASYPVVSIAVLTTAVATLLATRYRLRTHATDLIGQASESRGYDSGASVDSPQ